jgi:hypothetical protein
MKQCRNLLINGRYGMQPPVSKYITVAFSWLFQFSGKRMRAYNATNVAASCGSWRALHPPETTRKILDCLGLTNRAPLQSQCLQALRWVFFTREFWS